MLTIPKLKKCLRQIIKETIDQEELQSLEQKYQNDIIEKDIRDTIKRQYEKYSPQGWNLLNYTIEKLTELDDPQKHPQILNNPDYKCDKIIEILVKKLGFSKIGEGAFRDVYGKADAPFIIKLELKDTTPNYSGTNKIEYNTYFNYGSDFQPRNELFPKIYSYDKTNGYWIIFEKVNTLKNSGDTLLNIFQPLYTLFKNIYDFLQNEPSFYKSGQNNIWAPTQEFEDFINDPVSPQENFYYFFEFTENVAQIYSKEPDLITAFQKTLIKWILQVFTEQVDWWQHDFDYYIQNKSPEYRLLISQFNKKFPNLKPTPDVAYLSNFLKNQAIEDLHFDNIGYRDMKNHPSQPWKNLVILDFGEYGGGSQNSNHFQPMQNMPSPKVPSSQSGQGGWTF